MAVAPATILPQTAYEIDHLVAGRCHEFGVVEHHHIEWDFWPVGRHLRQDGSSSDLSAVLYH
jgi:hypothetical protein